MAKYKKCPFCAEKIKYEAVVCRYCKRELGSIEKSQHNVEAKRIAWETDVWKKLFRGVVSASAFIILISIINTTALYFEINLIGIISLILVMDTAFIIAYRSIFKVTWSDALMTTLIINIILLLIILINSSNLGHMRILILPITILIIPLLIAVLYFKIVEHNKLRDAQYFD